MLRLTDADPVEQTAIADTVIEDAASHLRLTTHDMVTLLDTRAQDVAPVAAPRVPQRAAVPEPPEQRRLTRPTVLHVRVVSGTGGGPEKTILRSPRYAHDEYFRMAVAYIQFHWKFQLGARPLVSRLNASPNPLGMIWVGAAPSADPAGRTNCVPPMPARP